MQETFEKLLSSLRNWPLNHFSTPTGREGGTKVVRYKRRQIGLLKATACFASCSQAKIGPNALLRHPKSLLF